MSIPSVFTHSPSDSMQVVGLGQLPSPAACFKCGSGTYEGGYVDFGVFYDYHGELLMCLECLHQASEISGCLLPQVRYMIEEQLKDNSETIEKLTSELAEANERLRAFDGVIADYVSRQPVKLSGVAGSEGSAGSTVKLSNADAAYDQDSGTKSKSVKSDEGSNSRRSGKSAVFDGKSDQSKSEPKRLEL